MVKTIKKICGLTLKIFFDSDLNPFQVISKSKIKFCKTSVTSQKLHGQLSKALKSLRDPIREIALHKLPLLTSTVTEAYVYD